MSSRVSRPARSRTGWCRRAICGFSGSIFTDTGGAIVFNLYTNPQEDVSIGIRHIPLRFRWEKPEAGT